MSEKNFDECTIAVIRIRGDAGVRSDIKNTLQRLKLTDKNNCVLLKETPDMLGMLKKVKDYITWGKIDDATKKELITKRGNEGTTVFRLHPPRGGFERKGIKKTYRIGGVLGDRKEKINELIIKML